MVRARGMTFLVAWGSLAALTFVVVACGSFSGSDGSGPTAEGDADVTSEASADSQPSSEACKVIYVDGITGTDANDGCTTDRPTHSIGAAILHAKAKGVTEVHVCGGPYDEAPITLDASISLLGSYDCTTFKKAADAGPIVSYVPSSILTAPNNAAATLLVTGAAVTAGTRIDGFAVTASTAAGAAAVHVTAGATPTLSNLVIKGGAGVGAAGPGSCGVRIDKGAGPKLSSLSIAGGSGTSSTGAGQIGSAGILAIDPGPFTIASCTIDGGTGRSGGTGSVGVHITSPSPPTAGTISIQSSTIFGGAGVSTGPDNVGSTGLAVVYDPRVQVIGSQLIGGTGTCTVGSCGVFGINAQAVPAIQVRGNSIVTASPTSTLASTVAYAVYINQNATPSGTGVLVTDNMVYAAGADTSVAVELAGLTVGAVYSNTIIGAPALNTYGVALVNCANVDVASNLIAAVGYGFYTGGSNTAPCLTGLQFRNNAVVGVAQVFQTSKCTDLPDTSVSSLAGANVLLGATSSANVRISGSCGTDSACVTLAGCAPSDTCYLSVLSKVPSVTTLFTEGWRLATTPPCLVTQGGRQGVDTVDF